MLLAAAFTLNAIGCGEGGNLAISAGAPATAVVRGMITDCGNPVPSAEVVLLVQQDRPEQVRPVDTEVGPVTTSRRGQYIVEVAPSFAVPGPASVELRVTALGVATEIPGGTVELRLGRPARDTVRLDADIGQERRQCG
jgi:hypothetical protein